MDELRSLYKSNEKSCRTKGYTYTYMRAGVKRILFLLLVKFRKKYARARVFIGIICMARRFHQEKIVFDA